MRAQSARMMSIVAVGLGVVFALPAWAESDARPAHELVAEGRKALDSGDYSKALEAFNHAAEQDPDAPELAYNQGVAHYRLGDYDQAADFFARALNPDRPQLEADARYNLGNCAYAKALKLRNTDPQAAIEQLELALDHYGAALEHSPADNAARANAERTQRLIDQIREQMQKQKDQQQQQQQSQDQQKQDDKQQDKQQQEQQKDQQQRDPNQPQDQQQQRDQQQQQPDPNQPRDEQQQQQQKQGEQQQDQQQSSNSQQDPNQQQDAQKQKQQAGDAQKDQARQQQSGEKGQDQNANADQAKSAEKDGEGQPVQARRLSREQAARLLQLIRDKERQRRLDLARRERAHQAPVRKDW